ncbi:hypothetical protein [Kribbella monticola]|uniref:hypothetical protein n=1 Tax=Kribbella monticola TaxID=2185285 RepID=UPI000DD2BFBD|nr:hypothetical protein [Kribbella monticola]
MTNLKNLLDEAAGSEPQLTDADLTADLTRGRRSLRRRRIAGIATAATGTVAAVGVALSLAPSVGSTDTAAAGDGQQTVTKTCGQLRTDYGLKVTESSVAHEMAEIKLELPGFVAKPAVRPRDGQTVGTITVTNSVWDMVTFTDKPTFTTKGTVQVPPPGEHGWSDEAWRQVARNCLDRSNAVASVKLVASGKQLPGAKLWCDLKPAGWTPVVRPPANGQYRLDFLPPGGGAPLVVSADAKRVNSFTIPSAAKLNSGTQHRFTASCHPVR